MRNSKGLHPPREALQAVLLSQQAFGQSLVTARDQALERLMHVQLAAYGSEDPVCHAQQHSLVKAWPPRPTCSASRGSSELRLLAAWLLPREARELLREPPPVLRLPAFRLPSPVDPLDRRGLPAAEGAGAEAKVMPSAPSRASPAVVACCWVHSAAMSASVSANDCRTGMSVRCLLHRDAEITHNMSCAQLAMQCLQPAGTADLLTTSCQAAMPGRSPSSAASQSEATLSSAMLPDWACT